MTITLFRFVHLSAGDLLREEQATDSKDSDLIKTHIKEGKIVPVEITCSLLHKAMIKKGMEKKFLIDGFPRNLNNMNGWNKQMHAYTILKQVLFFETTEETMLKRIMKRAKTSGRVDDNIEAAQKRFKTFKEETMPVIDIYTAQNLVLKIDGNREIEEVYADVVKGLVI